MDRHTNNLEVEVKLRIPGTLGEIRRIIKERGFERSKRRVFEQNTLFDTPDLKLRRRREVIRVRRVGSLGILTYKGVSILSRHKSREELETQVGDPDRLQLILARLGYYPVFRYEKFREEFERPGREGIITVDETPIGNFLELEGAPEWIDITARQLGFSAADYITRSYASLYLAWCEEHGLAPADMIFDIRASEARTE